MGGLYQQPLVVLQQSTRIRWVEQHMRRDPSGRSLGELLAAAVATTARHEGGKFRDQWEIGIWDGSALLCHSGRGWRPVQTTRFSGRPRIREKDTDALLASVPPGSVAGYFRIHDSGDVLLRHGARYGMAWRTAARRLPHVRFWMPTRTWAMLVRTEHLTPAQRTWAALDDRAARRVPAGTIAGVGDPPVPVSPEGETSPVGLGQPSPAGQHWVPRPGGVTFLLEMMEGTPNLVIRPSGLDIKTPRHPASVPYVAEGMATDLLARHLPAGSGVAVSWRSSHARTLPQRKGHDPGSYVPIYDLLGREARGCPVYSQDRAGRAAKSCRDAGCRACWLLPEVPIRYGHH
jgi:hypothetical protein